MSTLRVVIEMELPRATAYETLQELENGTMSLRNLDYAPEEITYEVED